MHLLLRADSDASIGAGHVIRSLALARRWLAAGGSATFLGRISSDRLRARIAEAGVAVRPLSGSSAADDLRQTLATLDALRRDGIVWAVVDGYAFGPAYHAAIRGSGAPLLVIDDLADLPCYHADIVLNQNLDAEHLAYHADADTRRLLGVRFALLQPEFEPFRDRAIETPPVARRIVVTTGGADPHGATSLILQALHEVRIDGLEVTVVAGPSARAPVEQAAAASRHACHVVGDVRDMAALMAPMDLAITGGGSTCWELAFLGLPAIVLELSDNQRRSSSALAAAGAVESAGPVQTLAPAALAARISALGADAPRRAAMTATGRRLVDGRGAARVVSRLGLGLPPLTLRIATPDDARPLWELATEPSVRHQSFDTAPIPWDAHAAWFERMSSSPAAIMWVMTGDRGLAGQVRYETRDGDAEIGISVAAPFRGYGLAARLLASTWAESCRRLNVGRARGVVFTSNQSSAAAFREAGFVETVGLETIRGHECHVFTRTLPS